MERTRALQSLRAGLHGPNKYLIYANLVLGPVNIFGGYYYLQLGNVVHGVLQLGLGICLVFWFIELFRTDLRTVRDRERRKYPEHVNRDHNGNFYGYSVNGNFACRDCGGTLTHYFRYNDDGSYSHLDQHDCVGLHRGG